MVLTYMTASGGHAYRQALQHWFWMVNDLHDNMATFLWAQALQLKGRTRPESEAKIAVKEINREKSND